MADNKDDELESLLNDLGIEAKEVADKQEDEEDSTPEVEILDALPEDAPNTNPASTALKNAQKKLIKKTTDLYNQNDPNTREKLNKRLSIYDSAKEYDKNIVQPQKITPDIEKVLFPYYVAGVSIRALWQQMGSQFGFGLQTLYKAKDAYLWAERKKIIQIQAMSEQGANMVHRMEDYMGFFDDLMSEGMFRFKKNSEAGRNSNPYEHLKVTNIADMKMLMEIMMQYSKVKKDDAKEIEAKQGKTKKTKITDKKAAKLLEILASDDDEDEEGSDE